MGIPNIELQKHFFRYLWKAQHCPPYAPGVTHRIPVKETVSTSSWWLQNHIESKHSSSCYSVEPHDTNIYDKDTYIDFTYWRGDFFPHFLGLTPWEHLHSLNVTITKTENNPINTEKITGQRTSKNKTGSDGVKEQSVKSPEQWTLCGHVLIVHLFCQLAPPVLRLQNCTSWSLD